MFWTLDVFQPLIASMFAKLVSPRNSSIILTTLDVSQLLSALMSVRVDIFWNI